MRRWRWHSTVGAKRRRKRDHKSHTSRRMHNHLMRFCWACTEWPKKWQHAYDCRPNDLRLLIGPPDVCRRPNSVLLLRVFFYFSALLILDGTERSPSKVYQRLVIHMNQTSLKSFPKFLQRVHKSKLAMYYVCHLYETVCFVNLQLGASLVQLRNVSVK